MNVYVVTEDIPYDSNRIVGVCASLEGAKALAEHSAGPGRRYQWEGQEEEQRLTAARPDERFPDYFSVYRQEVQP